MSIILGNLCSLILQEHFGELVAQVGTDLFATYAKSLSMIIKTTNLTKSEVTQSLAVLLKFRLVAFESSPVNPNIVEYKLLPDKILLLVRYSRYVHLIQTQFGNECAMLTEELLRAGSQTAAQIIVRAFNNVEQKEKASLVQFRDRFLDLVQSNYFIRAPTLIPASPGDKYPGLPKFDIDQSKLFSCPTIEIPALIQLQKHEDTKGAPYKSGNHEIYWYVNFERFHQEFRDAIMITAIERKIDANAGECFKYVLQAMYNRTDPWQIQSNPIPYVEIKQMCDKKSKNADMIRYLDQYLSIIIDDPLNFLSKGGDSGGGQYVVDMKAGFEQLTWACIENIIGEKFGTKAARIFRVVKLQKYIEQEDIQKHAMVPAKEAKLLTYRLLEENFLQIHTIRKAGGGGTGPAKAFYLFHVNQRQIVAMLIETSYKSLFNAMTRSIHDKQLNKRLVDKSQRLEGIVEAMKERGESEEYISEILETLTPPERDILKKFRLRVKNLYSAEVGLDDTIFLLQLFHFHALSK